MLPQDVRDRVVGYIQHQAGKSRPAILDLVQASQRRFLDVIDGLPDERAAAKSAPEDWSVRELIRHVIKAEIDVADIIAAVGRGQRPAPSTSGERGIGTMVADAGEPFAAYVARLRETNDRLLASVRDLPEAPDLETKVPHPFFGPLNCLEWAVFQRVHDEDHVQHAGKILAAV